MGRDNRQEIEYLKLEIKAQKATIDSMEKEYNCKLKFWQEMFFDSYMLTLHDIFGVSKGRYVKCKNALTERLFYIAKLVKWETDAEGNEYDGEDGLCYTKQKVDSELEKITPPEEWKDWNQRYYISTGITKPKPKAPKPEDLRKRAKALMMQADMIEKGVIK